MYEILLVIHTLIVIFLIGIILLQKPESDGLGGLGGSAGSILSGRAKGNLLTRTTAILATIFICTSIILAVISGHRNAGSIVDKIEETPAPAAAEAPAKPAAPVSVPKPE